MSKPEPWRKTGRKAGQDHWLGLEVNAILELSLYDDRGGQQGRGLLVLTGRGMEDNEKEGQTWIGWFLAVEDDYYAWWVSNHYPVKSIPFHFCAIQAHRCSVPTLYREPIHVDVFRVLPGDSYQDLKWMDDAKKAQAKSLLEERRRAHLGSGNAAPQSLGEGELRPGGADGAQVEVGPEGIAGLAQALGGEGHPPEKLAAQPERKRQKREVVDTDKKPDDVKQGLDEVLSKRKAPVPAGSALKMTKGDKKKKKSKKRSDKKKKRERNDKKDGSSGTSSDEDTSSSEDSLFRLAALPEGVDRLHRLHQERPGALGNLTLRRFQELLNRSTGGGSATQEQDLPPVARAYLSQIYLTRNSESAIGLRNLRELRTLATLADMIASNDALRALDVALQRMKAIELFISQGQWSQANLLELILPEDEQRAWFRQELKAAQQEHKSEMRLQRDQWPARRGPWAPVRAAAPVVEKKEGDEKDETPPGNGGGTGKGRKGRGKGKKGGKRW